MEAVAREWHERFGSQWTENHAVTILRRLEANVSPYLGSTGVGDVLPSVNTEDARTILIRWENRCSKRR